MKKTHRVGKESIASAREGRPVAVGADADGQHREGENKTETERTQHTDDGHGPGRPDGVQHAGFVVGFPVEAFGDEGSDGVKNEEQQQKSGAVL